MARGRITAPTIRLIPAEHQTRWTWRRALTLPAGLARRGRMCVRVVDRMPMAQRATTVGNRWRLVCTWTQRLLRAGLARCVDHPVRYSLRGVALLTLAFALLTSALAWRYDVSYRQAAQGLVKQGFLTGITALVTLYDPAVTKPAVLAPAALAPKDLA